jgi:hypothetical protein
MDSGADYDPDHQAKRIQQRTNNPHKAVVEQPREPDTPGLPGVDQTPSPL